jgi:hypothetical protein
MITNQNPEESMSLTNENQPKTVTNTKTAMGVPGGAMSLLVNQIIGGNTIEDMELMGRDELLLADQIPVDCGGASIDEQLQSLGFILGDVTEADPIFRAATLPPGWSKRATENSYWSDIVDDRGRVRFRIGYKAAYYDRWARLNTERRFGFMTDYGQQDGPDQINRIVLTDCGVETELIGSYGRSDWDELDRLQDAAVARLNAIQPLWREFAAYWDED